MVMAHLRKEKDEMDARIGSRNLAIAKEALRKAGRSGPGEAPFRCAGCVRPLAVELFAPGQHQSDE